MTVIAFTAISGYLIYSYFTIDYNLPKESLFLPLFLRSFGYVIVAICFLTVLSQVPFQNFFQAISIQAFVSAGFGGALGSAILGHLLKVAMKKNTILLSTVMDRVNPAANQLPTHELYGILQQQSLMVSMKEIYGWLIIFSLSCLLLFLLKESAVRPLHTFHPKYKSIHRFIKHELRIGKKRKEIKEQYSFSQN